MGSGLCDRIRSNSTFSLGSFPCFRLHLSPQFHVSHIVVKMPITRRARWCRTGWRWPRWLGSFCRGEAAFPEHHLIAAAVVTGPSCLSVSHPDKLFFPPPNWSLSQSLREEQDIGPELQQIYEVRQPGFLESWLVVRKEASDLISSRCFLPTAL